MHLEEVDDVTDLVGSAEWRNRALTPLGAISNFGVFRLCFDLCAIHVSGPRIPAAILLCLLTARTPPPLAIHSNLTDSAEAFPSTTWRISRPF